MNILPVEAGGQNIFARWSGRYEHFARLRRRGAIGCIPLYAQACHATFSARLDTKLFICPCVKIRLSALDTKYTNSDSAPLYGMVQKLFTEFHCVRTSTETIPNPGCPYEITTPAMINKIHDIVLYDRKVKVREIVNILTKRMVNILHRHLCMRKLCARWVPRFNLHRLPCGRKDNYWSILYIA